MPDEYLDGLSIPERVEMWTEALARAPRPRATRLVAEQPDGSVVGFLCAGPEWPDDDSDADRGQVSILNVDPAAWGQGAGRALLDAGVRHLGDAGFTEVILWVHPGNARARTFYARNGWREDGARREDEIFGLVLPEVRYRRAVPAPPPGHPG